MTIFRYAQINAKDEIVTWHKRIIQKISFPTGQTHLQSLCTTKWSVRVFSNDLNVWSTREIFPGLWQVSSKLEKDCEKMICWHSPLSLLRFDIQCTYDQRLVLRPSISVCIGFGHIQLIPRVRCQSSAHAQGPIAFTLTNTQSSVKSKTIKEHHKLNEQGCGLKRNKIVWSSYDKNKTFLASRGPNTSHAHWLYHTFIFLNYIRTSIKKNHQLIIP